ncbi:MAG: sigma-54 dependent transcriptional regulator [Desulfopila sp.]|jgi:DNA-binding NtrC family response regulator|nr:sigma-54 dependent transcriptional regulator [Desulfopila sp.]
MATVLIVDDAADLTFSLGNVVTREGYTSVNAATGKSALATLQTNIVDLIFLDIGLPDVNGIDLIPAIREISGDSDIVMLTGNNDAKTAVESLKAGAIDYIVKPFELIEFTTTLNRLMQSRLISKKIMLRSHQDDEPLMIANSKVMLPVQEAIAAAAGVTAPVLITGETGTGKELAARAIHNMQRGKKGVFVKVDCGTLSANLIESELFGHEKGAFTDASSGKKGLVEIADGGTLFLDEIGNLPISLQPKLLRLIAESTFRRVGGTQDIQVSVRIIAATNTNINEQITKGRFREDLYYRLNVIPMILPPLRLRREDIFLLADYYRHFFNKELKKSIKGFTGSASASLMTHHWPGNIRELRNLIEREMIFCKSDWLSLSFVNIPAAVDRETGHPLVSLRDIERQHIHKVLQATGNNKSKAAQILGITRTTLRSKIQND